MPYIRHTLDWRRYLMAWGALLSLVVLTLTLSGCKTFRSGSGGPDISPSNPDRIWP